jgi:hypothetical protein
MLEAGWARNRKFSAVARDFSSLLSVHYGCGGQTTSKPKVTEIYFSVDKAEGARGCHFSLVPNLKLGGTVPPMLDTFS